MRTPGRRPPEPVLDAVLERLLAYHEGLGFEVYQDEDGGDDRRFIVTAYGERDSFPAVDALVAAAPDDLGWRAIALKPERGFDFVQERDGRRYDPKEMAFDVFSTPAYPERVGLRVYLRDHDPDDEPDEWAAVEVLLLTGLGERRFGEVVERIGVAAYPDVAEGDAPLPLPDLPRFLDWLRKRHGLAP